MKKVILIIGLMVVSASAFAQSSQDMMKEFERFKSQMYSEYRNYLGEINAQYEQFLRAAWKGFEAEEPVPEPVIIKDTEPVVYQEPAPVKQDEKREDSRVEVVPVAVPEPVPAPKPVVKVEEVPVSSESIVTVPYYGAKVKIRYDKDASPRLAGTTENNVADAWHELCGGGCNNMLKDLFAQREERDLSDWAYYELCRKTAAAVSRNRNERELMTAFLLCQSGFKVKMGRDGRGLHTLVAANSEIFGRPYWSVDGNIFYLLEDYDGAGQMYIMQANFPDEKAMRLEMMAANRFDEDASEERVLVSARYPDVKATVRANRNLMEFYGTYPTSECNGDPMTRWWYYAMSPMDEVTSRTLYPALKRQLEGLSEKEKVERLLNFVQTSLEYKKDNEVWGEDRAFFAEETVYYPYCDCEDRSILFSRLVRDLVGLDVALVLYPGHLATAVAFSQNVAGDYMVIDGRRFTVSDPTFINAPVGMTMSGMDNSSARVIVLKH